MHPEIEKTLKKIAGGEIKTACVYSLIDSYYMCVVGDIDAEDSDPEPPFPEAGLGQPSSNCWIKDIMSMPPTVISTRSCWQLEAVTHPWSGFWYIMEQMQTPGLTWKNRLRGRATTIWMTLT